MTNDLFRDLLDGRIEVRSTFAAGGLIPKIKSNGRPVTLSYGHWQSVERSIGQASDGIRSMAEAMGLVGIAAQEAVVTIRQLTSTFNDPPADPRARALQHKQHQGTGPAVTPLRVRGRNTHYKEKG